MAIVGALSRALGGDDHIFGGDEFAVVIDVVTAAEVTAISRRLLRAAAEQAAAQGASFLGDLTPPALRQARAAVSSRELRAALTPAGTDSTHEYGRRAVG